MKILTIGTNGFLGSWVNKLLQTENTNFEILEIPGKAECDVTEFSEISNYLKEKSPDVVINCAAFVGGISYGYKYPVEMLSKNSLIAMNIYKASNDNAVKKLIIQFQTVHTQQNLLLIKKRIYLTDLQINQFLTTLYQKDFSYN